MTLAESHGEQREDLVFDGERFIPGAGVGIAYEHWCRYAFAANLVAGKDLLDVACGEGYGSAFLSKHARSVQAFDASMAAVEHARRVYSTANVAYRQATVASFFESCPDGSFDVVTAFEIIEHLQVQDQEVLLAGIRRVLRPGGFALISTPDKRVYTDTRLAKNPFHVREYYREEFDAELRRHFGHVQFLEQALFTGNALTGSGGVADVVQMAWTDLLRAQGTVTSGLKTTGEYVLAVVSQKPVPLPRPMVLADFSCKLIAEGLHAERSAADRLARELEEARRAWQSAQAETRRLAAECEGLRGRIEATSAEMRAVRTELAGDPEGQKPLVEEARARLAGLLGDVARLAAENAAAQSMLRRLPRRRTSGLLAKLLSIVWAIRQVSLRDWVRVRPAIDRLRKLRVQLRGRRVIEDAGLFDPVFYLSRAPDVAERGVHPLDHYLAHGSEEGRQPHPLFDTIFYADRNADVVATGVNPLVHFIQHGWKEGRAPHPRFDVRYYVERYPDVSAAGLNPLSHYLQHGAAEGRDPSPEFSTAAYLAAHPEVAAAGWNPLVHAVLAGAGSAGPAAALPVSARLSSWREEMLRQPRRALVVDETMLTPDRDSGSITTLEIMKSLQALGYAVTFVPFDLSEPARYVEALERAGFSCLTRQHVGSVQGLIQSQGDLFDVVVLSRITTACHLADPVRRYCPDATLVFETMDIHFLRMEREAALMGSERLRKEAQATRRLELDAITRADVALVHSTAEQEMLARETPSANVAVLPYILEAQGRGPGFETRRDLVFIGGFLHRPNVDAVVWFAREVFPLVRRQIPEARFLVVGSSPTEEIQALASDDVVVLGYVPDLRPLLDACRLTVAPLRYGAGYKGKVAMSMAHGVPVVLTPIGAEGMELEHEGQVLIADDPAGLAAAVVRLYRDAALWERLSRASLEFVTERFSAAAGRRHLAKALQLGGADLTRDHRETVQFPTQARSVDGHAVFPSRFMQALHERSGLMHVRSSIVPHGVQFAHAPDAPRVDRSALLSPGKLSLLIAGRIVHFKGVHTAIEALKNIADASPDLEIELTIVGDTQDTAYMEKLRRLVAQAGRARIEFLPAVPEAKLFELFQRHDLYLFPSLFEPFALTLILALEAGIPTVASAAGGNVDIVVDHETGLLFPAGDAEALAKAVVELTRNPQLRAGLSAKGRAKAAEFTHERMVSGLDRILRMVGGDPS